jgi:uncharacterized protein with HEPN domain
MRHYKLYLRDIIEAMESIEQFIEGMDFEEFNQDDMISSAVIRKLEIIGEATKGIPERIRQKYPQIPWRDMAGMRDKLIHFYFGIDHKLVWQTVKNDMPPIKPEIRQVVDELEEKTESNPIAGK